MKITVYELLGLVKDDKAPKKIKHREIVYERGWADYMGDEPIDYYYVSDDEICWTNNDCGIRLDDTVEILEEVEDKEYEDIEVLEGTLLEANEDSNLDKRILCCLATTINALIRNQKYILEQLKNK